VAACARVERAMELLGEDIPDHQVRAPSVSPTATRVSTSSVSTLIRR
jgi:hypothetical protein